jgi:hypothetical protein
MPLFSHGLSIILGDGCIPIITKIDLTKLLTVKKRLIKNPYSLKKNDFL